MAQHDYDLANQSGAAFRADLNNALAAIVSQNSGGSAPSTTYAFMPWLDTSVSPPRLKIRNSANSAWEEVGEYAQGADIPYDNSSSDLAATTVDTAIDEAVGLITRKNILMNGDFMVWQRNTTFTPSVGTATYMADRWRGVSYTAANTFTPYLTSPNRGIKIAGVASNTGAAISQRIESVNCYHLSGAAVTFSADIYSTGARTLTWTVSTADSIDDFSATTSKHTDTVSLSAGWNYGATFTISSVDSTVTRGCVLTLAFGAVLASNDVYVMDAQLEAGSVPTDFERIPKSAQLALCQRYYEQSYSEGVAPGTSSNTGGVALATAASTSVLQGVKFSVAKREAPTITIYSPDTGTSGEVWSGSADFTVTAAGYYGQTGFGRVSMTDAVTKGDGYYYHWVADAEL